MVFVFLGSIALVVAPAFAQVQAWDYKDQSQWRYIECDGNFLQPEDENYLVWHEDYIPVGETIQSVTKLVIVVHKPLKREVLDTEGEEKFVSISKDNPWLLYQATNPATTSPVVDLFEYKNGAWEFVKNFNSDEELLEFIQQEYKLQ